MPLSAAIDSPPPPQQQSQRKKEEERLEEEKRVKGQWRAAKQSRTNRICRGSTRVCQSGETKREEKRTKRPGLKGRER